MPNLPQERKTLSKALIPCSPSVNAELRKKHHKPTGFFYGNEAGELFCTVSKPQKSLSKKYDLSLHVEALKISKAGEEQKYSGMVNIEGKKATVTFFSKESIGEERDKMIPKDGERGRQAFRLIIQEALRNGAKQVELTPIHPNLGVYYRKKFGFSVKTGQFENPNPVMELFNRKKQFRK